MSSSPTITDVAKAAGVAKSTVSCVINGQADKYRIGHTTQERILTVARQLGYHASPVARDIALGKGMAPHFGIPDGILHRKEIGLILSVTSSAETLALIPGLELILAAADYRLVVITVPADTTVASQRVTQFLGEGIAGVLCCPSVYAAVSATVAGKCPVIVLWQGAGQAMVSTLKTGNKEPGATPKPVIVAPAPVPAPKPIPPPAAKPAPVTPDPEPSASSPVVVNDPIPAVPVPDPVAVVAPEPIPAEVPPVAPMPPQQEPEQAIIAPPPETPPLQSAPEPIIMEEPVPTTMPEPPAEAEPAADPVVVTEPVISPEPISAVTSEPEPVVAPEPDPIEAPPVAPLPPLENPEPVIIVPPPEAPPPQPAPEPIPIAEPINMTPDTERNQAPEIVETLPAAVEIPIEPVVNEPVAPT